MFQYDNLINYFKTNFALMQHHKYSLSEIENMIPWERQVYLDLLKEHIEKENEKIIQENNRRKAAAKAAAASRMPRADTIGRR
jgi:hemerythrin-like domain-containing protein